MTTLRRRAVDLMVMVIMTIVGITIYAYATAPEPLYCFCCEHEVNPNTNPEAVYVGQDHWFCSPECAECEVTQ